MVNQKKVAGIGATALLAGLLGYEAMTSGINKLGAEDEVRVHILDYKNPSYKNISAPQGCELIGYAEFNGNVYDFYKLQAFSGDYPIRLVSRASQKCEQNEIGRGILNNDAENLFNHLNQAKGDLEELAQKGGDMVFKFSKFPKGNKVYLGNHYLVGVPTINKKAL